jgi:hypothetical protein
MPQPAVADPGKLAKVLFRVILVDRKRPAA